MHMSTISSNPDANGQRGPDRDSGTLEPTDAGPDTNSDSNSHARYGYYDVTLIINDVTTNPNL